YNAAALENLEWAMRQDPEILIGWHQLAIAYARNDQNGMASLASAERYSRAGARQEAVLHAKRALHNLPEGSPGWLRAQDIIETGKSNRKQRG
ncbi:MAG TPA: peptidase M48, partial [Alphaproteobacteria bacterium]|nr:peptidase M48 [Alphaproteobacteria bacterium]